MYAIKNEVEDKLFQERSGIIKRMNPESFMRSLGINERYIITEQNTHLNANANVKQYQSVISIRESTMNPFNKTSQDLLSNS